ncbi:C40 family peptidase [bacterium]|nr:C40 family peptidase [bacterium]MBU1958255.1 C40 family peptidase [bacterium]
MKKLLLIITILQTILLATPHNVFIIKDKNGKLIKGKRINHVKNVFYDDLIKEQNEILKALDKLQAKKKSLQKDQKSSNYDKSNILANAKKYLGGKYVWGGTLPEGFDCSGYVQYIYEKEGVSLPRTAWEQSKVGKPITKIKELAKGDLLFFKTTDSRPIPITHVGLYLGNDKFIHAASRKKGIIISSLSKSSYGKKLVKATRIIK